MERFPAVCIQIVTRDRAGILPRAIESALGQDYEPKEVRVLDDASEDGTPALAARFPGVRWERSESRMGIPAARNRLMADSTADFIIGLDDDAWFVGRDAVSRAVRAMLADRRIGALAFDVISPGRDARREPGEPQPWHTFQGCGHMLRMEALKEIGIYAMSPGWYGSEEKDLCIRLLDSGFEIALLPGAQVWHEKSEIARDARGQHASGVCNDMVFAVRRGPWAMLAWLLPAKALGHLYFSLSRGLVAPCFGGLWRFTLSLPSAIGSRRPVRWRTWREYGRRSRLGPKPLRPARDLPKAKITRADD